VDYTGLTREESYGHGWNKPFHPDDQQRAWDAWQRATQRDEPYTLECRLQRADGNYRWWLIRGVPVRNARGEILKWFGTCTDIDDIKQAEEKLGRTLERFELAAHASRLGIWDWHIPGNHLVWDEQMYELYGIKETDFGGAYEAWLATVHPEDRAESEAESQRALRGEKDYDREFRVVWPDGSVRHLKSYGRVIRDDSGQPLRMTGVNFDITERKHAETVLRARNDELERFNRATVGRELRMIELKREIDALLTASGQPARFAWHLETEAPARTDETKSVTPAPSAAPDHSRT